MDKRTIIGIVLIVIITLLMPFYQRWIRGDREIPSPPRQIISDSILTQPEVDIPEEEKISNQDLTPKKIEQENPDFSEQNSMTDIREAPVVKTVEIEHDFLRMVFSSEKGGNPILWELKNYKHHSEGMVNLIKNNFVEMNFLNVNGKIIDLSQFNFYSDDEFGNKIQFSEQQDFIDLNYYLPIADGKITKTIRVFNNRYDFAAKIIFENLQGYIINRKYSIGWQNGLPPTEINIRDDNSYARAFAYMAEELENLDASDKDYKQEEYNGRIEWVAIRTKYFLIALFLPNPDQTIGASLGGVQTVGDLETTKLYNVSIDKQLNPAPSFSDSFRVYLGPLDYYELKKYNIDLQKLVMNKDWYERLFRPISLLIIPAFKFLYRFIPNYGLVIIVFSILVKLLLHPLTKKSYQSMSEMQYLQPKMTEIRDKYKNDPQRLNKEMMKLYKEHGVNPMGGCLPMLLQMPLLFSLFIVFRSTIQLRGKPFGLWINDLSAPDILHLGFTLPIIGNNIHVLPILMGITMIWQSKMSITDPKQKMMSYFMPLFMIFIFYSLPSGLNLYYAIFNVLSMLQTRQIKKKMHPNGEKIEAKASGHQNSPVQKIKSKKKKS
jgi:YidC/Oxa1 family membrane protein insertase